MKLNPFTHEGRACGIAGGAGWIESRVIEEPA